MRRRALEQLNQSLGSLRRVQGNSNYHWIKKASGKDLPMELVELIRDRSRPPPGKNDRGPPEVLGSSSIGKSHVSLGRIILKNMWRNGRRRSA